MKDQLYNLRDSKNRLAQLMIVDDEVKVADDLKYTSESDLEDICALVHERDKLGAIAGKDILGIDERRKNNFIIVNTSKKHVAEEKEVIVVRDSNFILVPYKHSLTTDMVVGEFITEVRFTSLTSFKRF